MRTNKQKVPGEAPYPPFLPPPRTSSGPHICSARPRMASFVTPPSRTQGQISSRKPPCRAGLAVLLPGLSLGLKLQQRPEQVTDPSGPAHCGQKQTLSALQFCMLGSTSFSKGRCPGPSKFLEPWGEAVPPALTTHTCPKATWGLIAWLSPPSVLDPPRPPAPAPSPSRNIPEAWPPFPLSLVCRPPFQIHVKSITFLACTRPDTHHSLPPSQGSENPVSSSLKTSDRTAPLRHFVRAAVALRQEAAAEFRGCLGYVWGQRGVFLVQSLMENSSVTPGSVFHLQVATLELSPFS